MSQLVSPERSSSSSSSFSSENNLTSNQLVNTSNSVMSPNTNIPMNYPTSAKTYLIKSSPQEDYDTEKNTLYSLNRVPNQNTSDDSFHNLQPSKFSTKIYDTTTNMSSNVVSSTRNSNSFIYSNTSSDNNTTQSPPTHFATTPKASFNQQQQHNKVVSLNDQILQNPKQFLRKTTSRGYEKPVSDAELAPIKDQLHAEIVNRMSKKGSLLKKGLSGGDLKKQEVYINVKSTAEEVKKFLESKDFSQKVVLMFGELTGEQLFTLEKSDFETYCGKEEGIHLDSQVKVQKSLSGYVEKPTNELENILKRRKEKSENTKL